MASRLTRNSKYLFNLLKSSNTSIKFNYRSISVLNQKHQLLVQNKHELNLKRFYSADASAKQIDTEEKVLNIFKNFDRIKENPAKPVVTLNSHVIKDLGLDSLDHTEIIVQLEDTFGFEIPDSDYEKLYSIKEIVDYVVKKAI